MHDSVRLVDTAPLLTAAEVARRLSVSEAYIYRLWNEGRLASVRMGRRCVRSTPESVQEFIQVSSNGGSGYGE